MKAKSSRSSRRISAVSEVATEQLTDCRISELRRDLQAAIITKANLHIGPAVENYGGETFLSQEVAVNLMQEYKLAFKRCEMVCKRVIFCPVMSVCLYWFGTSVGKLIWSVKYLLPAIIHTGFSVEISGNLTRAMVSFVK